VVLNPLDKNLQQQVKDITADGFDVIFEASGAGPALRQAFDLVSQAKPLHKSVHWA
jgi:threonine dehydrogenase-like Zn-dependent dehydrogenase